MHIAEPRSQLKVNEKTTIQSATTDTGRGKSRHLLAKKYTNSIGQFCSLLLRDITYMQSDICTYVCMFVDTYVQYRFLLSVNSLGRKPTSHIHTINQNTVGNSQDA